MSTPRGVRLARTTVTLLRSLARVGRVPMPAPAPAPVRGDPVQVAGCVEPPDPRYPPGSNRRLIDWVRSPATTLCCRCDGCDPVRDPVRETDVGPICLGHYLERPRCLVDGCHRPQADPRRGKRYKGIYTCWEHDVPEGAREEQVAWSQWAVDRRAAFDLEAF